MGKLEEAFKENTVRLSNQIGGPHRDPCFWLVELHEWSYQARTTDRELDLIIEMKSLKDA